MSIRKQSIKSLSDGSVRSGKTMSMTIGFVLWSMKNFNNENFAFCGKTIDSLKRNVITPMQKWLEGVVKIKINLSRNFLDISMCGHTNRYYFFGGKDESSYQLIQGITLAGILLDEVALQQFRYRRSKKNNSRKRFLLLQPKILPIGFLYVAIINLKWNCCNAEIFC